MLASSPCSAPQAHAFRTSYLLAKSRFSSSITRAPRLILSRHQVRYFRPRWSSQWDPDDLHSQVRQHRALWQKFAKLHGEFPHPRFWPGDRYALPGLMRQILRFEKWAQEIESSYTTESQSNNSRSCSGRDNTSKRRSPGTPTTGYWEYHHNPFQAHRSTDRQPNSTRGRALHSANETETTSTSSQNTITRKRVIQNVQATNTENVAPVNYYIDPVTNKRVAKPGSEDQLPLESESSVIREATETEPNAPDQKAATESISTHHGTEEQTDTRKPHSSAAALQGTGMGRPVTQSSDLSKTESSKPMTGYYMRDFPEDFAVSWKEHYKSEENTPESKSSSTRLEPALNRVVAQPISSVTEDEVGTASGPKSEEPPETQRTSHRDLVEEIKEIYEESYGKLEEPPVILPSSKGATPTKQPAPSFEEGTTKADSIVSRDIDYPAAPSETNLYRILVYDSEAGEVSIADATSVAADHQAVLTPSEVMPRLSNPGKFLSHFGHLQAQGYEAVSGSGDVLVFRKVRDATEPGSVFLRAAVGASVQPTGLGSTSQAPAVNPIDMMGSESVIPNIGNFTSPTGYISYDHDLSIGGGESGFVTKPPPPFRKYTSIAASSDANTKYDSNKKTKDRNSNPLWRMTAGAGTIAGLVYVGSVVNEYFTTGGESGEGTKGFL